MVLPDFFEGSVDEPSPVDRDRGYLFIIFLFLNFFLFFIFLRLNSIGRCMLWEQYLRRSLYRFVWHFARLLRSNRTDSFQRSQRHLSANRRPNRYSQFLMKIDKKEKMIYALFKKNYRYNEPNWVLIVKK